MGYEKKSSYLTPCILCKRPGMETTYFMMDEEDNWIEKKINLCRSHKGVYMAHGIKKLSELMSDSKIWEKVEGL